MKTLTGIIQLCVLILNNASLSIYFIQWLNVFVFVFKYISKYSYSYLDTFQNMSICICCFWIWVFSIPIRIQLHFKVSNPTLFRVKASQSTGINKLFYSKKVIIHTKIRTHRNILSYITWRNIINGSSLSITKRERVLQLQDLLSYPLFIVISGNSLISKPKSKC